MASLNMKKMLFKLIALAAFMKLSSADADNSEIGSAIVQNKCPYDVYIQNTPAEFGGYVMIPYTLQANEGNAAYKFKYTQLSNAQGWSMKLSTSEDDFNNIMQFETTFHDDGMIWYDLSDVNGNPWDGNWEITSSGDPSCTPKHAAYRYSTDDAYGMQACQQAATLTVTLCSGDSSSSGSSGGSSGGSGEAPSASAPAYTNTPQPQQPSYSQPSYSPPAQPTYSAPAQPSYSQPAQSSQPAPYAPSFSAIGYPVEVGSTLQTSVQTTLQKAVSPSSAAVQTANVIATVTEVAGTTTVVTTTWSGEPSDFPGRKRDVEEHAQAHEHLKRHQDAFHKHHGHY